MTKYLDPPNTIHGGCHPGEGTGDPRGMQAITICICLLIRNMVRLMPCLAGPRGKRYGTVGTEAPCRGPAQFGSVDKYTTAWTEDQRREGTCPGPLGASVSLEPPKAPALVAWAQRVYAEEKAASTPPTLASASPLSQHRGSHISLEQLAKDRALSLLDTVIFWKLLQLIVQPASYSGNGSPTIVQSTIPTNSR